MHGEVAAGDAAVRDRRGTAIASVDRHKSLQYPGKSL
jgi:hypothetical protein